MHDVIYWWPLLVRSWNTNVGKKQLEFTFHNEILDYVQSIIDGPPMKQCDVFGVTVVDIVSTILNLELTDQPNEGGTSCKITYRC